MSGLKASENRQLLIDLAVTCAYSHGQRRVGEPARAALAPVFPERVAVFVADGWDNDQEQVTEISCEYLSRLDTVSIIISASANSVLCGNRKPEPIVPDEQKAMIRPRKCCGGFRILHAIQPRMLPTRNVIPMLTGMNHL